MSSLMLEEMEVHFNQTANDRSFFEVASNDPVWTARLERAGAKLIRQRGETRFFILPSSQLTLRKAPTEAVIASRIAHGKLMAARLHSKESTDADRTIDE